MIAVDTNIFIYYLDGKSDFFTEKVDNALLEKELYLPPVVMAELLSAPNAPLIYEEVIGAIPILQVQSDYWKRAGKLRKMLLEKGIKARLPDVLIAQSCIDAQVPILSNDNDFRHFQKYTTLEVISE